MENGKKLEFTNVISFCWLVDWGFLDGVLTDLYCAMLPFWSFLVHSQQCADLTKMELDILQIICFHHPSFRALVWWAENSHDLMISGYILTPWLSEVLKNRQNLHLKTLYFNLKTLKTCLSTSKGSCTQDFEQECHGSSKKFAKKKKQENSPYKQFLEALNNFLRYCYHKHNLCHRHTVNNLDLTANNYCQVRYFGRYCS